MDGFDQLREVEPADWPERQILDGDNMGDWGAWLSRFELELEQTLIDPEEDVSKLAAAMAGRYLEDCIDDGIPLPTEFGETPCTREGYAESLKDLTKEFTGFLNAWRRAWLESRRRAGGELSP